MGYNVTVDVDKCVGCGECVDICPVGVYEMKDGKSDPVNADECVGCESCIEVCEGHCITVQEEAGGFLHFAGQEKIFRIGLQNIDE